MARSALTEQIYLADKAARCPFQAFAWQFLQAVLYLNETPYPRAVAVLRQETLEWISQRPSSPDHHRALRLIGRTEEPRAHSLTEYSDRKTEENLQLLRKSFQVAAQNKPGFVEEGLAPPVHRFLQDTKTLLRFVLEMLSPSKTTERLQRTLAVGLLRRAHDDDKPSTKKENTIANNAAFQRMINRANARDKTPTNEDDLFRVNPLRQQPEEGEPLFPISLTR